MNTFEDIKKFVIENNVVISLVVLLIAVVYINIKINDLDYRVQQTIIYSPLRQNERSYGYQPPPYNYSSSRWF